MSRAELIAETTAGVSFLGWEDAGVMGAADVRDATLIRHSYVRPTHQGRGLGSTLLDTLTQQATGLLLVGTWATASWAIRLYERHGFEMVSQNEKDRLLDTYWKMSPPQRETSVILREEVELSS